MTKLTSGFTLIELLVSIGIITLLMIAFLPNIIKAREGANNSSASNFTRSAINVSELRRTENGGEVVYPNATDCTPELWDALPRTVDSCQFRQDANATYVVVKSSSGKYFYFDGSSVRGPTGAPPNIW